MRMTRMFQNWKRSLKLLLAGGRKRETGLVTEVWTQGHKSGIPYGAFMSEVRQSMTRCESTHSPASQAALALVHPRLGPTRNPRTHAQRRNARECVGP